MQQGHQSGTSYQKSSRKNWKKLDYLKIEQPRAKLKTQASHQLQNPPTATQVINSISLLTTTDT